MDSLQEEGQQEPWRLVLERYWAKPLARLPKSIRARLSKEVAPLDWDVLTVEQRQLLAAQLDQKRDSEDQALEEDAFNLTVELEDKKRELRSLEVERPHPSMEQYRDEKLAMVRADIQRLQRLLNVPPQAAPARGVGAQAETEPGDQREPPAEEADQRRGAKHTAQGPADVGTTHAEPKEVVGSYALAGESGIDARIPWHLVKPDRWDALRRVIYQRLTKADVNKRPPSASEMLEEWRESRPSGLSIVGDSVEFWRENGKVASLGIRAIQVRIDRMALPISDTGAAR